MARDGKRSEGEEWGAEIFDAVMNSGGRRRVGTDGNHGPAAGGIPKTELATNKPADMKTLRFVLLAALGFAVLAPATAEAGGCRTRVTRDNCGNVLYWEYAYVGRSWDGCPRFDWVVVRRECPPPPCRPSFSHGGYNRGPSYAAGPQFDGGGGYYRGNSGGGGYGYSNGSSRSRRSR